MPSPVWGAAFGDPDGAHIIITDADGVRIRYGTVVKAQIDASGNALFVSGNVTIDQNGLRIAPSTTPGGLTVYGAGSAYGFQTSNGNLGLYGWDANGSGAYRGFQLLSTWNSSTGGSTKTQEAYVGVLDRATFLGSAYAKMTSTGTVDTSTYEIYANTISLNGSTSDSAPTVVVAGALTIGTSLALGNTSLSSTAFGLFKSPTTKFEAKIDTARFTESTNGQNIVEIVPGVSGGTGSYIQTNYFGGGADQKLTLSTVGGGGNQLVLETSGALTFGAIGTKIDANGYYVPASDNTKQVGDPSKRFSLVRGVTITSGDLSFENGWTITEAEKVGIAEEGLAILNANGDLVYFLGENGLQRRGANVAKDDVDARPYVKTTNAERSQMDRHPELRRKTVVDADGSTREVPKTSADVRPMPDPRSGLSNAQRKAE